MGNKNFSDVTPNRGDKNAAKEGIKSTACTKPYSDPKVGTIAGPAGTNPSALRPKGGKDLPAPKFTEQKHFKPEGKLP